LRELGQLLREKRVELGVDLDQVQAKTKIRKRYLMALEAGEWDSLPGEVYARGFVRSYAELLGLDGLELLQKYAPHPGAQAVEEDSRRGINSPKSPLQMASSPNHENAKRVEIEPQPRASGVPNAQKVRRTTYQGQRPGKGSVSFGGVGQFAVVAGILVVLGGGWYYVNHSGNKPAGDATGTSNANLTIANQTASNPGANTAANSVADGGNNATNLPATSAPTTTVTTGPFQNGTQTYVVHTSGTMNVQLTAGASNCWIRVVADNVAVDPNDTLLPGQSKSWPATQNMLVRVGRVEAVTLTVNGVPMTLPSVSGAIDIQISKSLT